MAAGAASNYGCGAGRSLNVAYLYGAYEDSKNVMLVMELCKGGEMWKRVRSGRYSEKGALSYIYAQPVKAACARKEHVTSIVFKV